MSTRSITTVKHQWGESDMKVNANIYRHHDGYLEGHGQWLYEYLNGLAVVNGIGGDMPERWVNGPDRLAADMVSRLQDDGHSPGLLYLQEGQDAWQEYHYVVLVKYGSAGGEIFVTVHDGPAPESDILFSGSVDEYGAFLSSNDKDSHE